MPEKSVPLPDFTRWPSFPFEGDMRIKRLAPPVDVEPPRSGEDAADCVACNTPDDAYIWVSERWRVRAMDRPTGLPMVLILECRSHLDLGDLPNLLAAELGVMTVRLERAIRTLDEVARVHVNRWGDGSAHLHMWFLARPYGRLQLRGTFLSLWDDILPDIPEQQWRENLALVAAWLAEFGGRANAEPPHIQWQSPGTISESPDASSATNFTDDHRPAAETAGGRSTADESAAGPRRPADLADVEGSTADNGPVGTGTTGTGTSAGSAETSGTGTGGTGTGGTGRGGTGRGGTGRGETPADTAGRNAADRDADPDDPSNGHAPAEARPGDVTSKPEAGASARP